MTDPGQIPNRTVISCSLVCSSPHGLAAQVQSLKMKFKACFTLVFSYQMHAATCRSRRLMREAIPFASLNESSSDPRYRAARLSGSSLQLTRLFLSFTPAYLRAREFKKRPSLANIPPRIPHYSYLGSRSPDDSTPHRLSEATVDSLRASPFKARSSRPLTSLAPQRPVASHYSSS